ncbi:MAG: hypothetical protein LBC39_02270 [Methanobrevibacter sp.]|jgi:hypothetical protein|nr:hypothetical protein [Candidatus Methanovirga aequatorialis]
MDKESLFQPERLVDPENFEGKKEIIETNIIYLNQASKRYTTHFLIRSRKGI